MAAATVPWEVLWIGFQSPCQPGEHNDTLPGDLTTALPAGLTDPIDSLPLSSFRIVSN